MKTLKEQIEVMQASLRGKRIESRIRHSNVWAYIPDHFSNWDWTTFDYRVARKPVEGWVNVYPSGCTCLHESKENADRYCAIDRIACVKVREVVE